MGPLYSPTKVNRKKTLGERAFLQVLGNRLDPEHSKAPSFDVYPNQAAGTPPEPKPACRSVGPGPWKFAVFQLLEPLRHHFYTGIAHENHGLKLRMDPDVPKKHCITHKPEGSLH